MRPVALVLAGYDKVDSKTKKKKEEEIREAYDGDVIYIGLNKFLRDLVGKPVIQYVIDAIYNAKKGGKRIYEKIYVYNDVDSFKRVIDVKRYPSLEIIQMTESVGGHWKDFYFNHVEYGQRVDIFFGDTPRITAGDVEWIHGEYNAILGRKKDHRGNLISLIYGIVEYEDMKDDNWLPHRIKFFKKKKNRDRLKSFVRFDTFQARVGNAGAMIKTPEIDGIIGNEAANFVYNLRKALNPKTLSRILYYLWKTKQFNIIKKVKNDSINEREMIDSLLGTLSYLHKADYSTTGGILYHIKKNGAHWENDIDGPLDFEAFRHHFEKMNTTRTR